MLTLGKNNAVPNPYSQEFRDCARLCQFTFDTADVDSAARFDVWRHVQGLAQTQRRVSLVGRAADFSAQLRVAATDAVTVSEGRTSAVHEQVEGGSDAGARFTVITIPTTGTTLSAA